MIRIDATNSFLAPVTRDRRVQRMILFVLLSVVLVFAIMVALGLVAATTGLGGLLTDLPMEGVPEGPRRLIDESWFIAVLGAVLALMAVAILAAAMIIYRRWARSFLWPGRRFSPRLLLWGFVFMAVAAAVAGGIAALFGTEFEPPLFNAAYALDTRLIYAATAGGFLFAAAAAEEVVLRGVLLQITAAFTRNALVLCVLNGLIFAAIHVDPDPIAFISRALSGAAWAWAALRLGGLEFAIGAHWANNLMIALFAEPFSAAAALGQGYPVEALLFDLPITLSTVVAVEILARRRSGLTA